MSKLVRTENKHSNDATHKNKKSVETIIPILDHASIHLCRFMIVNIPAVAFSVIVNCSPGLIPRVLCEPKPPWRRLYMSLHRFNIAYFTKLVTSVG
jgi:hypothetical protein